MPSVLVQSIRAALRDNADPERAPRMQAYMKSSMPFLGVPVPTVRRLTRNTERAEPLEYEAARVRVVRTLWNEARYREERYAATELLNTPRARIGVPAGRLTLLERLIVEGAWWDHVDELSHRVGDVLLAHPTVTRARLSEWAVGKDPWLRRSSIISQLGLRERTDLQLLSFAIEASATETGFFLRKAIGWALRDYARTDPEWVRRFLADRALSPLSVREATKHLDPTPG